MMRGEASASAVEPLAAATATGVGRFAGQVAFAGRKATLLGDEQRGKRAPRVAVHGDAVVVESLAGCHAVFQFPQLL